MRLTYFFNHKARFLQRAWGLRVVWSDGKVGPVQAHTVHSTKAEVVDLRRRGLEDGTLRDDCKWEVVPVQLRIVPEH